MYTITFTHKTDITNNVIICIDKLMNYKLLQHEIRRIQVIEGWTEQYMNDFFTIKIADNLHLNSDNEMKTNTKRVK